MKKETETSEKSQSKNATKNSSNIHKWEKYNWTYYCLGLALVSRYLCDALIISNSFFMFEIMFLLLLFFACSLSISLLLSMFNYVCRLRNIYSVLCECVCVYWLVGSEFVSIFSPIVFSVSLALSIIITVFFLS